MSKINVGIYVLVCWFALTGCAKNNESFVVGISQPSQDAWREKANEELRREASSIP